MPHAKELFSRRFERIHHFLGTETMRKAGLRAVALFMEDETMITY